MISLLERVFLASIIYDYLHMSKVNETLARYSLPPLHGIIEVVVRMVYYGFLTYNTYITTFDVSSDLYFGAALVFLMIQAFLLNHLLRSIGLMLGKESFFSPSMSLLSIFGLIFFIGLMVKFLIIDKHPSDFTHLPLLIFTFLSFVTAAYLLYKELSLAKRNKAQILALFK